MQETLRIKIDFARERRRPAEIFQAMSGYIEAYQALGQVIAVSVGAADDFELRLENVETGSIASLLKSVPGRVRTWVEDAVFDAGVKLAGELSEVDSTSTEEEVDLLATKLEAQLSKLNLGQTADPMIDRKALAIALSKFSEANKRLLPEESATATLVEAQSVTSINTHWRFNANPKDMFLGVKDSHVGVDKLYVRAPVNIGKGAWSMLSVSTGSRYNANIFDLAWLEGYQDGLIRPIGPKDVMEAEVAYEIYTPPAGKGKPFISSAKIKRVIDIHRDVGLQHEPRPLF
ncbi:hypothetical protein QMK47_24630 [Pseudomonas sp. P9_35]|uniref:hypothetical protein n=1 Tax=unclassified Pseudomonas TaxID=196821 RepID=UPI002A36A882|nr:MULTISPECIES: hypothetical protein [unclassified Pseudomonas]WPN62673.1 hypothetical protein QMK48_23730 [Pseudomonas sp. P9_32]WPN68428.1 hypothetical protein QMK47_24630 [Pseudomonas sp. P9_35]